MREKMIAGNIYHAMNRGVDKRIIFIDDSDYLRFIHDLFEFNDQNRVNNVKYFFKKQYNKDIASPYINEKNPREMLVEILAFCLMPNHYHLLLRPKIDNGVSQFMKKLNIGYAKYFNEKYKRSGTLFQGRYKSVAVSNDRHLIHLPYYIHFNPLDLKTPEWRERNLYDFKKAVKFLESYRWSSHLDYSGKKNFPSVTQRNFLLKYFGGEKEYRNSMYRWLKDLDIENIKNITLE